MTIGSSKTVGTCEPRASRRRDHKRLPVRWGEFLLGGLGLLLVVGATSYVVVQMARCPVLPQSLCLTYIAMAIIPFGFGMFLYGKFPSLVRKRRSVEQEELNNLYLEIDRYKEGDGELCQTDPKMRAVQERTRLQSFAGPVFEIDALPLRQTLVDLYQPEQELIAKARRELELLAEYTSIVDEEVGETWTKRINSGIKDLEGVLQDSSDKQDIKRKITELQRMLRAELKSLRETVAWYDRTWAFGEWMRTCATYWICATVITTILVGLLPIVHEQGNFSLSIAHWAVLGAGGALLSILHQLHNLDLPELGETQGKQLLQGTARSIAIGAVTAILLYAAIWGEVLDGKVFPDLPTGLTYSQEKAVEPTRLVSESTENETNVRVNEMSFKNVGLSVFWGVFAGLSPVVLGRLSRVAGSSLGEVSTEGKEE